MPYIEVDEIEEGYEAADVVARSEYDAVISERDEVVTQRDEAIVRAETAEADAKKMRDKYAKAFLTTPQRIKEETEEDVKKESRKRSFSDLWKGKGDNSAY